MTATQPVTPVCPECGKRNTMVLSNGLAFCFDDHTEWDPAAVSALPRPQKAPEPAQTAADVLGPPSGAETGAGAAPEDVGRASAVADVPAAPALEPFGMADVDDVYGTTYTPAADVAAGGTDELIGGTARLEGGQVATVLSFPDADHVVVRTNDGRDETVALGDVEHITPRAPAYVIDTEPEADTTFDDAMALSGRMVAALSAIIDEVGEGPVVEGAVTLTLSRMIIGYEVEIEDLMGGIEQIASVLAEGDQPTEET